MVFLLFLLQATSLANAEEPVFSDNRSTANAIQSALFAAAEDEPGRLAEKEDNRMEPWKVAAISAVIPGYGQVYNKAYWKIPILYGLLGYFGYKALDYQDSYEKFRDKYADDPQGQDAPYYKSERNSYQEKRNEHLLFLTLAYLAGIIDAYVDAHLYDFDVISQEEISTASSFDTGYSLVGVRLKF